MVARRPSCARCHAGRTVRGLLVLRVPFCQRCVPLDGLLRFGRFPGRRGSAATKRQTNSRSLKRQAGRWIVCWARPATCLIDPAVDAARCPGCNDGYTIVDCPACRGSKRRQNQKRKQKSPALVDGRRRLAHALPFPSAVQRPSPSRPRDRSKLRQRPARGSIVASATEA